MSVPDIEQTGTMGSWPGPRRGQVSPFRRQHPLRNRLVGEREPPQVSLAHLRYPGRSGADARTGQGFDTRFPGCDMFLCDAEAIEPGCRPTGGSSIERHLVDSVPLPPRKPFHQRKR